MSRKNKNKKITLDTTPAVTNEAITPETLAKSMRTLLDDNQDLIPNQNAGTDGMTPEEAQKQFEKKPRHAKVLFESSFASSGQTSQSGDTFIKGMRRLQDRDLRHLASIDPHISAIINTRVSQATAFGDLSDSQFDKGIRLLDPNAPKEDDFDTPEEYQAAMDERTERKNEIMEWLLGCGFRNQDLLDEVFENTDKMQKNTRLKGYIQAQTRNLLTFGRCYRENIRSEGGELLLFRPAPAESIEPVRPSSDVHLSSIISEESTQEAEEFNQIDEKRKPIAWVQRIDGIQVGFFTESTLREWRWQNQSLLELNGYPLCPIEFAMYLVYIHQHSLQYLRNQFTKGLLNRSLITIATTDPDVELSPEDISAFRREMQNLAMRSENSSSIPVISGPVQVQVQRLDLGPKDIEWLNLEQSIIRALCSAFQIAPSEVGFGLLGDPAGLSAGEGSKDVELIQGEERGLRILVDLLIEDLNDAIWDKFPDARHNGMRLIAVGLGSETRSGMLARLQTEAQLTATLNDLYSQSEKNCSAAYGGNVPLNPLWHQNAVRYMHYGKFAEEFLGEEGASTNPLYDFLVDPGLNAAYQQNKQMQMQMQQQAQQPGQPQQPQADQQEPEPSLQDQWQNQEKLNKSLLEMWNTLRN